jgi:long-chain fatty acid transport protein
MARRRSLDNLLSLSLTAFVAMASAAQAQQGVSIAGTGPVNLSFAGATTAAPLDAQGALYWNPATLMGLERSELGVGLALLYPQTRLTTGLGGSAILPGVPPKDIIDSQRSDAGVFPLPGFAFAYKPEDQPWAVGIGAFPIGGFSVNFPASRDTLVLSARAPLGVAQGPIFTNLQVFNLVAAGSVQLTDKLSFGFAPVINMTFLQEDPGIAAIPDVNFGVPNYPSLTHSRFSWGAGFDVGLYYELTKAWRLGLSYRSTQWLESLHFHDADPQGRPRNDTVRADFPSIASLGVSYAGLERWLFAADVRYVDYKNSKGFGGGGFNPDGSLNGLGWNSIFEIALGAQYQVTDCITLRSGYSFNENPIPGRFATENAGSGAVERHTLYVGGTYRCNQCVQLSVAYVHVFGNSITGPVVLPGIATLPASFVRDEVTGVDSVIAGITVQF